MRIVASLIGAVALMGASSIAYAATAVGDITSINKAQHSLTLDKVSTFAAPKGANLSHFKVGENVSVAFAMRHGKMDATAIRPMRPIGTNIDKRAGLGG
jgi:carbonic anhydrase/acetyltransferase-like protein (isoleucine patch superfamily)